MRGGQADAGSAPAHVQVRGTVLTVRRIDAYYAMTVVAPGIAARFRPGQFVGVAVGGPQTAMLLRRVFSIHDVRPDHGGTVEFVFAAVGPGTRWLAERRTRDVLDIAGPLGRPFPVPRDPASCLLVGGGYGSAPLFPLASRLRSRGCTVDFLLGAASADRVFGALTARRTGRTATIATEDGSLGGRGLVTDFLTQVIHEARTDVIYACGPMGMLRQVTALAGRYDIPVQALVEESMACGIGVCMTCVLPVVGEDGVTRMVRSCVDGPVFRGDQVRWNDIGTIPFDALGAPGWKPRPMPKPRPQPGASQAPGQSRAGRPDGGIGRGPGGGSAQRGAGGAAGHGAGSAGGAPERGSHGAAPGGGPSSGSGAPVGRPGSGGGAPGGGVGSSGSPGRGSRSGPPAGGAGSVGGVTGSGAGLGGMPPLGAGLGGMPPLGAGLGGMPPRGAGSGGMPQRGAGSGGMPQRGAGSGGMPQRGAGGAPARGLSSASPAAGVVRASGPFGAVSGGGHGAVRPISADGHGAAWPVSADGLRNPGGVDGPRGFGGGPRSKPAGGGPGYGR